jgi:hypothetical protein
MRYKAVFVKKLLILLTFFGFLCSGTSAVAQCYSSYYGCAGSGYYFGLASYTYFWNYADKYQKAAYATDMFFGTLQSSIAMVEESRAMENYILQRRDNLENYKSVQRYYNEGIPPFANRAPDGKPRSPKITWDDVQSIGLE